VALTRGIGDGQFATFHDLAKKHAGGKIEHDG
jgi:hypothetical protein